MKKTLNFKEVVVVGITLFGMFFGAGNLIFPVHLGQLAGNNVVVATLGFIVTAVTIPIFAVAAIGITHSHSLQYLCNKKVGKNFGYVFTTLLYLTIGPFFAIPRCCTTTFSTGVYPLLGDVSESISLFIFSAVFFGLVLFFSLRPTEIMTWIGKVITPAFLIFFGILLVASFLNPGASIKDIEPDESYVSATSAFFNGVLEGYNTMDAIAGLAFGIIVVSCIKSLGVNENKYVATEIMKSGIVTGILMGIIYFASTVMGTQSRGLFETSANGGIALAEIAEHYLGKFGSVILALSIGFACLKTAIGLVESCSSTFVEMLPEKLSYRKWVVIFTLFSFAVSNVGLTALINYSVPVLMLIYPIAIVLIALCLLMPKNRYKIIFECTLAGATFAALFDFVKTLPFGIDVSFIGKVLPFYNIGMSWVVPSLIGFIIGYLITKNEHSKLKLRK